MGSRIEWCDQIWNPVSGCTPVSTGCNQCYARKMAKRLAGRCGYPKDDPFMVTLHWDRVRQGTFNPSSKPRKVFVCSMGDLFHEDVPDDFISQVFHRIEWEAYQHTFLFLTKRPRRMRDMMEAYRYRRPPFQTSLPGIRELPSRWWFGVSLEDQQTANERIPILCQIPAAVRFISAEPLLSHIDLGQAMPCGYYCDESVGHVDHAFWSEKASPIRWVVVGGESGPHHRPMEIAWVESIVRQCREAGVKLFVKQSSHVRPGQQGRIPDELWAVKEFPEENP